MKTKSNLIPPSNEHTHNIKFARFGIIARYNPLVNLDVNMRVELTIVKSTWPRYHI